MKRSKHHVVAELSQPAIWPGCNAHLDITIDKEWKMQQGLNCQSIHSIVLSAKVCLYPSMQDAICIECGGPGGKVMQVEENICRETDCDIHKFNIKQYCSSSRYHMSNSELLIVLNFDGFIVKTNIFRLVSRPTKAKPPLHHSPGCSIATIPSPLKSPLLHISSDSFATVPALPQPLHNVCTLNLSGSPPPSHSSSSSPCSPPSPTSEKNLENLNQNFDSKHNTPQESLSVKETIPQSCITPFNPTRPWPGTCPPIVVRLLGSSSPKELTNPLFNSLYPVFGNTCGVVWRLTEFTHPAIYQNNGGAIPPRLAVTTALYTDVTAAVCGMAVFDEVCNTGAGVDLIPAGIVQTLALFTSW
ncbi:hypothetical protein Pelo_6299 [Pelomyxa schiedti]|nr:hypothetical protein Pelo_6299 [Pelomyxa schiedti]